jgi:hypothetical protein
MSVRTPAPRPVSRGLPAGLVGALASLLVFVVVLLTFVLVPLALFAVGLLALLLARPRGERAAAVASPRPAPATRPPGLGTGAR